MESFWNHRIDLDLLNVPKTQQKQASPAEFESATSALGKGCAMQKTNVFIGLLRIAGFQSSRKRNVFSKEKVAWNHFGIIGKDSFD